MNESYQCYEGIFQSPLKEMLTFYVQYKESISGCKIDSFIPKLRQFDRHCVALPYIDVCLEREAIMGFLQLREGESRTNQYNRATILKGFLEYMSYVQGREGVYLFKLRHRPPYGYAPHIFQHEEVLLLLNAAEEYRKKNAPPRAPNLPNSMQCIISMLYCTGMRISETLDLTDKDVDLDHMLIYINHAKNDNCRVVTISSSLGEAIKKYLIYSRFCHEKGPFFFQSGTDLHKGRISIKTAYSYFRRYLEMAGIEHRGRGRGPRLHDLRATFAVHSLQKLSKMEGDINARLSILSTYLGHKSIHCTQRYWWLTKELYKDVLMQMEGYVPLKTDASTGGGIL
jgi:integrase